MLFHGGMGSWKHWIRNIDALGERFTVHALDHPAYGDSASVPRETTGPAYLELVHTLFVEAFPGDRPLRLAGFSFGAAIATNLARRLGLRVTHLCLVSPGVQGSNRATWQGGADCEAVPVRVRSWGELKSLYR